MSKVSNHEKGCDANLNLALVGYPSSIGSWVRIPISSCIRKKKKEYNWFKKRKEKEKLQKRE